MRFYFDENFPPSLPKGLYVFQNGRKSEDIEVFSTVEVFGRGAKDENIIPQIAQQHGTLITQDFNIHRTSKLNSLCQNNKIGIFFFRPPKGNNYQYWDLIRWAINQWKNITDISKNEAKNRPFSYIIKPKSQKPEKL
ncbi:MAG: hypothetical protein A2020_13680 [Lentisphaerae bacterium GWF2_45_14]|nr:MAG: hypothetical protein A2020_13680 [Lentisphaerae bacterium GWF2_45_14]